LTVLAYSHSLRNGFIWDDDDHLTQNPAMLSVDGLKQIWSVLTVSRYYPLTLTTFWLERRCWGLQPLPYHAVNVVLQAVNALLLWTLLRHLKFRGAWVAAAVWAIHPVNVETVAWITELKNTQSGFFCLLALLLFLRFEDESRWRDYWLALLFGVAAMLSKPSTVVLPGLLLLCAWWRRGGWTRRDWLRVTPLLVFGAGMSLLTIVEQRGHIDSIGVAVWALTPAQRLSLPGRVVWFYAGKLFWPVNLCFIYPNWVLPVYSVRAWLPLAALAVVAVDLWRFRRAEWARPVILGLGWFVIGLVPVLGLFDIFFFQYSYVADHFQYLAGMGLIAGVVGVGAVVMDRVGERAQPVGTLAVAVILFLCGTATWRQTEIYQDEASLWGDTLAKNPRAWLAYNNQAVVLMKAGRVVEAIRDCEQVQRLNPGYDKGYYNLGVCLMQVGQMPAAIEQFEKAIQLQPNYADAECNLGVSFVQTGHLPEAMKHYERAIQIDPNHAGAHYNLGIALSFAGRESEALDHWQQAVRINPDYAEAHNNLGVVLSHRGRMSEAIDQWQQAVRAKPDYAEAFNNLGVVLAGMGRLDEAVRDYQHALQINPQYAEAHNNLGVAFERAGRIPEAIEQYEQALRLRPDLAAAQESLARLKTGR
jgi:tetratricopeptide (TPR) repeat protein